MDPADYDAWYATRRGRWIAAREFALLRRLMRPSPGESLLDVGCGTGHFSRRFAAAGLRVRGVDPDVAALDYARVHTPVSCLAADATALPWRSGSFDWVVAVTSFCFVSRPEQALREAWRVARRGVALGLLNRRSLLYRRKHGRGGYAGARWDTAAAVGGWVAGLDPPPGRRAVRTAVLLPAGGGLARLVEALAPTTLPWGGFLAVVLEKSRS